MSLFDKCLKNMAELTGLRLPRMRKIKGFIVKSVAPTYKYLLAAELYSRRELRGDALLRSVRSLKDLESAYEIGIRHGDGELERRALRLWIKRVEGILYDIRSFEVGIVVLFSSPLGTPVEGSLVERLIKVVENRSDAEWLLWYASLRHFSSAVSRAKEKITFIRLLSG